MDKKKILIILAILIVSFIITVIIVIATKKKPEEELPEKDDTHYATNEVVNKPTNNSDAISDDEEDILHKNEKYYDVANEVTYEHLEILTPQQKTEEAVLIKKISTATSIYEKEHGKMTSAEILESSTEDCVYINTIYEDNTSIIMAAEYDNTYKHRFLRCVPNYYKDLIDSGENAG